MKHKKQSLLVCNSTKNSARVGNNFEDPLNYISNTVGIWEMRSHLTHFSYKKQTKNFIYVITLMPLPLKLIIDKAL